MDAPSNWEGLYEPNPEDRSLAIDIAASETKWNAKQEWVTAKKDEL